jgi:sialate O-acetylesterase
MLRRTWFAFALLACASSAARADVKPNGLFTSGMVLQQNTKCPIWGVAAPNEKVSVHLDLGGNGIGAGGAADKDGNWRLELTTPAAGGPYTLTIAGQDNTIILKKVYVGEVWVCSGQSNMWWPLKLTADPEKNANEAKYPQIRLYTVPMKVADRPQSDVTRQQQKNKPEDGVWHECTPENAMDFSAVAYYFGRALHKARNVPIGLIHTSWGGTRAEAWTSRAVLEPDPAYKEEYVKFDAARKSSGPSRNPNDPSVLYNAMIAPLIPYAIKGAIWYQGESNAGKADAYRTLFPTMIKNWRDDWRQGDFPFLFVQLAPWQKIEKEPKESAWAELREAQLLTALKCPKTGMAVITDVGDEKDIHPKAKEPVGERLALGAQALAYGVKIEYSGPVYEGMKVEGNKAILSFSQLGGGLVAKGGPLTGFTIAGEDRKFHNAQAEIQDDKIVVTCDQVEKPVAVRFGWANFPVVNLWNKAELPASPFRTDDWPGVTAPKK